MVFGRNPLLFFSPGFYDKAGANVIDTDIISQRLVVAEGAAVLKCNVFAYNGSVHFCAWIQIDIHKYISLPDSSGTRWDTTRCCAGRANFQIEIRIGFIGPASTVHLTWISWVVRRASRVCQPTFYSFTQHTFVQHAVILQMLINLNFASILPQYLRVRSGNYSCLWPVE